MQSEYLPLKECWVGRSYSPDLVDDPFVKDILRETEEDLEFFSDVLTSAGVVVRRPEYTEPDVTIKPQLLHARDHLQRIGNTFYVGPRYQKNINDWLNLLDGRMDYITLDNMCAPSVVRADRVYVDAIGWTKKRFDWLSQAHPDIEFVYERFSNRAEDIERHTDGVFSVVKEGVIIATPSARNLEYCFPGWDILYVDINSSDLKDMNYSKEIVWSPSHIPDEYRQWVGYSPETFFDVNCLQLDSEHLMVTRYNKQVFEFLKKHNVEPIVVPFRHRYLWDGGLHCMTFDFDRS